MNHLQLSLGKLHLNVKETKDKIQMYMLVQMYLHRVNDLLTSLAVSAWP